MSNAPDAPFDLSRPRRVHVVGVGGAGMSAVAIALVGMGHSVSGSDLKWSPIMQRLQAAGVEPRIGHSEDNLSGSEAVTVSTAVPESNLEVRAAMAAGIPVLSRAEMLASIRATRRTVAVAGTHGKTTTASMLALVLIEAGMRPSFIVGGELNEIGAGATWDEGEWLVLEADESDGSFLHLLPDLAVVTNVEPDHLERYGSFEGLQEAFGQFLSQADRCLVSADDPIALRLGEARGAATFGQAEGSGFRVVEVEAGRSGVSFSMLRDGGALGRVELPVPGLHNALNGVGALAAGMLVGADFEAGRRALARFTGVARRFQHRGVRDGVTFIDDYGHLPSEIRSAIETARLGGWDRVVCVFQPHRYSRTASLWQDFADAFGSADLVVLTDVYAAGEPARPGVSGKLILEAVSTAHPDTPVVYMPNRSSLVSYLRDALRPGDVCLTVGAGDITSLPDVLMAGEAE
jgi:UDP-N-acetylmuramate--alanine ligase